MIVKSKDSEDFEISLISLSKSFFYFNWNTHLLLNRIKRSQMRKHNLIKSKQSLGQSLTAFGSLDVPTL